MKNIAGMEIKMLSLNFILTINPHIIRRVRPKEEIINIKLNLSPTSSPAAPINCKTIVNRPIFSRLNRLNSFFIWGDMK
jgi:hypothetical protein